MSWWKHVRRARSLTSDSPRELFGRLGAVVSQTRDPGDLRSESVLYEHARRRLLERSPDHLIAREEWHRLS